MPAYLLAFALATPLSLLLIYTAKSASTPGSQVLITSWVSNLFLVHAYYLGTYVWNSPSWSLSTEFAFYLAFPILAWLVISHLDRPVYLLGATFTFYLAAWALLFLTFPAPSGSLLHDLAENCYRSPLFRIWEFLMGCALGKLYLVRGRPFLSSGLRGAGILLLIAAGCALALVNPVYNISFSYVFYALLAGPLIFLLVDGPSPMGALLSRRLAVLLGEASYSLYVIHAIPVMALLLIGHASGALSVDAWATEYSVTLHGEGLGLPVGVAAMAATVMASVACYRYVEVPARRALRGPSLLTAASSASPSSIPRVSPRST